MKRFLFFILLACIFPINIFSQTLTSSIAPDANTVITYAVSHTVDGIDYQATGTDLVWDFSVLSTLEFEEDEYLNAFNVPVSYYPAFTNVFIPPVANSARENFDDFNVPAPGFNVDEAYTFYNKSVDAFVDMGFALSLNSIPFTARYDNPEILLQFPLNYGDSWSSNSVASINAPTLGYWEQERHRQGEVEASGKIILHGGTELEVLKVKSQVIVNDSIFNDIVGLPFTPPTRAETYYEWYAEGFNMPVVEISTISVMGQEQISTIRYQPDFLNSIHDESVQKDDIHIYYDAQSKEIVLHAQKYIESGQAEVYNVAGQNVFSQELNGFTESRLSTTKLSTGIYYIHFTDKLNNTIAAPVFVN